MSLFSEFDPSNGQLEIRVRRPHRSESVDGELVDGVCRDAEVEASRRAAVASLVDEFIHLGENSNRPRKLLGSERGQLDLSGSPVEEPAVEDLLEVPDPSTERWLREVEPLRCTGEVQLFGDQDEGAQQVGFHAAI